MGELRRKIERETRVSLFVSRAWAVMSVVLMGYAAWATIDWTQTECECICVEEGE